MLYQERCSPNIQAEEPWRRSYEVFREGEESQYVGMLEERNRLEMLHLMTPNTSTDVRFRLAQSALEHFTECEVVEVSFCGHAVHVTRDMTRGEFEQVLDNLGLTDDEYGSFMPRVEHSIFASTPDSQGASANQEARAA